MALRALCKHICRTGSVLVYRNRLVALILAIIVCYIIYNERRTFNMVWELSQFRRDLIKPPFAEKEERKHDVILSAYMNSGSRFKGKLLGFIDESFYFYEPLWKFAVWDYYIPPDILCSSTVDSCRTAHTALENQFHPDQFGTYSESIVEHVPSDIQPIELMLHVLSSIFRCDLVRLKNVIQERVHDHAQYAGPSWESYRECFKKFNPKSKCLRDLEQVCKNKTHRVMKVIRLSVASFRPLLEINPRLKIVHLVRDPRAIINSRQYSRFYPIMHSSGNDSLERNLCDKMLMDIRDAIELRRNYPDRVVFLFYEDLIDNLHARLKLLYSFLNLTYSVDKVNAFGEIQINLSPPESEANLRRNRKHNNSVWWRQYMKWEQIQKVDRICYDVYNLLGYKRLSEKHIRDANYSSYKIPDSLKI